MYLVPVSTIRNALGYDNLTDIVTAIKAGLDTADVGLAASLRTTFEEQARVDYFHVKASFQPATDVRQTSFLLKQGFVQASPAYTMKAAPTRAGLAETSAVNLRDVTNFGDLTSMDTERGVVIVDGYDLTGLYVKVGYTAGFGADADEEDLYDQTEVPTWLQEMAKVSSMIDVVTNPSLFGEDETKPNTKVLTNKLGLMITDHVRYEPLARKPLA